MTLRHRCSLALYALWALPLLAPATAHPENGAEPCRASAEVRPVHAVPGQQILYVARVVRREDVERVEWERPLAFPGFRAEWLPGRAEDTRMQYRGVTYLAREEQRALFAARAGRWTIPGAALRCRLAARGPSPGAEWTVAVPPVVVQVDAIPERGRPDDWNELVGPVGVQVVAEPRALNLGETVNLSVQLRGAGNVWVAEPPLAADAIPGFQVFPYPPELELDPGERLGLRRFFRYDLVPRHEGALALPALHFTYYDPALRRFETVRTEPVSIAVAPRPAADPRRESAPEWPGREGAGTADGAAAPPRWLAWAAVGLAGVLAAGVGLARWRRARHRPWSAVERALEAAREEADRGDPPAEARELARALRAALACLAPDLARAEPRALRDAARGGHAAVPPVLLSELAAQLEALDWIRFSDELGRPDRTAALALLDSLRRAL